MTSPSILLSTTAFNQAARCMKQYEYANVAHLIPKHGELNPKIRKGIWIHKCLETLYSDPESDWEGAIDQLYRWGIEHDIPEEKLEEARASTVLMLNEYIKYWADHDDVLSSAGVVLSETPMTFDLPKHDTQLRATVDAIVEIPKRGLWVVEHKSTSHIPDANWRCSDPQTAMQVFLAMKNGYDIQGVIFNYLWTNEPKVPEIVGLKDKGFEYGKKGPRFAANAAQTTTSKFEEGWHELYNQWAGDFGESQRYHDEQYGKLVNDNIWFQRYEVYRPKEHLSETLKDIRGVIEQIKYCGASGHYPRSYHVIACQQFCAYQDLCSAEYQMGKSSPERRSANFIIDTGDREGR